MTEPEPEIGYLLPVVIFSLGLWALILALLGVI